MKILFTTPIIEYPAAGGPQLRIENSIKALSRVSELHLMVRNSVDNIGGENALRHFEQYVENMSLNTSTSGFSTNRYWRKLQKLYHKLHNAIFKTDARQLADYVRDNNIDIVWFGYGNISYPLIKSFSTIMPEVPTICDTDSVWSRFVLRELPYVKNPFRKLLVFLNGKNKARQEISMVETCTITTGVSAVDVDYYASLTNESDKVMKFSNVIDINMYDTRHEPLKDFKKPAVFFAGTFGRYYSPMDVAGRWLLGEILPLIIKKIPDIHVYIVGKDSDLTMSSWASSNITVTGLVPSVLPYLQNSDVAVVPLKFESGTRFKILEASACKIPVVSTKLGAEGINISNKHDIMIADSKEDFARAIIEIIENKQTALKIAENAYELVKQQYSIDSLASEAESIIKRVIHG